MQPHKASIVQDLIEKNRRQFKIPVYQRNYDWSHTECAKLYEDILEAFEKDKKHFTGAIVYIKGSISSSRLSEDLLIDGQQRITTVFLLLKAMLDIAKETNSSLKNEIEDYLFNRHCEEEYKLKLKPVKSDDDQFHKLMHGEKDELDASSNIIANYNFFIKSINRYLQKPNALLSDIMEGLKQLETVEIVLDKSEGDDPQAIFESINSTGLELSLADLVRNFILMSDANQDQLFNDFWLPMEKMVESSSLAEYLTQYLNFRLPEDVNSKNAYEKFKKLFKDKNYTHKSMLKELKKYAKYYALFIGTKSNGYSEKIISLIKEFRQLDQSTIYPFLFSLFDDFENKKIEESELVDILQLLISYCVRRIICNVPSNSLRGFFKSLYNRLYKNSSNDYYGKLYSLLATSRTKDRLITDEEFKDNLINSPLYPKKKACKYLMAKIENSGSHEILNTDSMTIEHLLPQKENSLVWKNELGSSYQETYDKYLHTLGNLTITGYNSVLGTKSFAEKKRIIAENSKANKLNKDILNCEHWSKENIIKRANNLSEYILEILKVKVVPINQEFNKSNEDKYGLEDAEVLTGSKPAAFIFEGERTEVNSYVKMLMSFLSIINSLDDKKLVSLAKDNFKITDGANIYLSYDKSILRKPQEVDNTGIFAETNISTRYVLLFIKCILEECNVDTDDFEIEVARKKKSEE